MQFPRARTRRIRSLFVCRGDVDWATIAAIVAGHVTNDRWQAVVCGADGASSFYPFARGVGPAGLAARAPVRLRPPSNWGPSKPTGGPARPWCECCPG
jgi:hypothetical protein